MTEIKLLEEPNIIENFDLNIFRYNKTHFCSNGEFELKHLLDNSMKLDLLIFNLDQNHEYKEIGAKMFGPFCKTLYNDQFESLFRDLKYSSNIWDFGDCPIPKVCDQKFFLFYFKLIYNL